MVPEDIPFTECPFFHGFVVQRKDRMSTQNEFIDNLDVKELEYINKMRCYVNDNCSKFAKIVEKAISHNRVKIETEATQMQFDSIKIGNVVGRKRSRGTVSKAKSKTWCLFKAMDISLAKVQSAISVITGNLRQSLERAFSEVARGDDRLANLVKRQLEYSFLQHFQTGNEKGQLLNEQWKRSIAKDVLDSVDADAIASRISASILSDLENGHELFKANLAYIRLFCQAAAEQSDAQRQFAAAKAPHFARLMSNAKALSQTLAFEVPSKAAFGARVGRKGHRSQVFEDKSDKPSSCKTTDLRRGNER
ncbi:hypothetical protein OS493_013043 [Desmophyllum pertusum]|uniref:Uncharacterized protein n=1 Tax=Desmophyllum pertusum TaxID=174260 RepID=A0A9W9Z493_9CNID|nr:hypothetical protein OS493_013043 [Desmophyllum pertusum]